MDMVENPFQYPIKSDADMVTLYNGLSMVAHPQLSN